MNQDISNLRQNYTKGFLVKADLAMDPIVQFQKWLTEAIDSEILEPNAFSLATLTDKGSPSSRIVLLKDLGPEGFVFYTNYNSRKGQEIIKNPNVAMNFLWKEMQRQVRIEGKAAKISFEKSEKYFHSRPFGSQVGAVSSNQSTVADGRDRMEEEYKKVFAEFEKEGKVPLPGHWGGYLIRPSFFEFWQGRESRLHDRFEYSFSKSAWQINRLEP